MAETAKPKLSVLMAVYNGETYLREALHGLLGQSFEDFEVIAVDDGSTDSTFAILDEYAARDIRIQVVRSERNEGLAKALNRGLSHCRAEYVARADADDISLPERFETQLNFLKDNPQTGVLSSASLSIDEHGKEGAWSIPSLDHDEIQFRLLWMSPINHGAVMYRRRLVEEAGGYHPDFWTAQDYELWSRLSGKTRFANIERPLIKYRRHSDQTTATRGDGGASLSRQVSQRLLRDYLRREVGEEETQLIRQMLNAFDPLEPRDYRPALELLKELIEETDHRGDARTSRLAHRIFAGSCLKHSVMLSYRNPARSRLLFREAASLHPQLLLSRTSLKQAMRLCILGPCRRFKSPVS